MIPYEQMDDLGGNTPIFGSKPHMTVLHLHLDIYRFTVSSEFESSEFASNLHLLCCSPGRCFLYSRLFSCFIFQTKSPRGREARLSLKLGGVTVNFIQVPQRETAPL